MVADGYTCTLRPIFAPKQRSRNRLQPKHGLGLSRKSGCASVHSTRRIISSDEYFLARRFCLTSSIVVQEVRDLNLRCQYLSQKTSENRIHSATVMLSEAKHPWSISVCDRYKIDPRFFASLRMTLSPTVLSQSHSLRHFSAEHP